MGEATLRRQNTAEIEDAILQLAAAKAVIERTLLDHVAEFDRRQAWRIDGARSMAAWLATALNVGFGTASRMAETAERLTELPAISARLGEGRLSFDQARELGRFATADTDETLADEAQRLSVRELQHMARRAAAVGAEDEADAQRQRRVRWWWDGTGRLLHLDGLLPGADGALVARALERIAENVPGDPDTGVPDPPEARRADALVAMASQSLGRDSDPDRATVVVHVDADALATGEGPAEIEAAATISNETARRLACDARWQLSVDREGAPVGIGRTGRRIPPWLARQLAQRDQGCRFPGCGLRRWVHGHHIEHWIDGGPTDIDNLLTLCGHHHRLVHERGWRLSTTEDGTISWHRPDGSRYEPGPAQLRAGVRARIVEPILPHWMRSRIDAGDSS
jgi:hypothetical protein